MILRLSLVFLFSLLVSCIEEPSNTSLISQSRINAGPYVRSESTFTSSFLGTTTVQIQSNTARDLIILKNSKTRVMKFVSESLDDLHDLSCEDGLINIHIIPERKINDRNIMVFTKNEPEGLKYYGMTTWLFPNIAWSFICSDCDETSEDIFVHELAHFYMTQCGIPQRDHDESYCHNIVDEYKRLKLKDDS